MCVCINICVCFFYGVTIIILCEKLGGKLNFDMIFYVYMCSLDMHIILYILYISYVIYIILYILYDISKWFAKYNTITLLTMY